MITLLTWASRNRPKKPPTSNHPRKRLTQRIGEAVDTFASDLAPSWGARRSAARHRRELVDKQIKLFDRFGVNWPGAASSDSRDGRYLGTKMSPDEAIEQDLPKLRERCVEQYRGNTVAHSAIEGRVSNEVGTGIKRQPRVRVDDQINKIQAGKINDQLKDVCDRWSRGGVDKRRRLSLSAIQRLVCRTYATYGEAFILLGEKTVRGAIGLTLDVISPERVETPPEMIADPMVRMGIRYNAADDIVGYYVRYAHPDATKRFKIGYRFIPRFDATGQARMVHVFDPIFPEQSRGIPWFATALNRMKDLDDFFEAELIAKEIEACLGIIFTGGKNADPSPQEIAEGNASARRGNKRLEDLEPGFIHYAQHGEDVKTVDPQRPGASFAPFIELSLRSIASALNFPYEILGRNFSRVTFSSGRLAMLDGWKGFAMRQQVLIEQFLEPVWSRIVQDAVFIGEMDGLVSLADYVARPWVYERNKWIGQGRGFIDPDKEVRAHVRANDGGIETKMAIAGEKGEDWEDTEEQLDREERRKIELRIEREVWENDLREQNDLPPLKRTYTENIGGAIKSTNDDDPDESSETDQQEQEDREMELANA